MRIGIDANWAIYENAGIGKYTQNLIRSLLETDTKNQYVLYFNFFRHFKERKSQVYDLIANSKTLVEIEISKMPAAWKEWLTQTNFPITKLLKKEVDVYHTPFFAGVAKNGFPKTVVTLHDLVFEYFPEHRGDKLSQYYLNRTKLAIEKSKKIIAVSESTKNDLIKNLNVNPDKIGVIYEGVNKNFHPIEDKTLLDKKISKYLATRKYILSVGTLEPRKNLVKLVKAYALLPNPIKRKYKLVLTGKQGWNNSELEKTISNLNLKDKILKTGYIPDEDLPYLYAGASVFVYPSLYEGFGLPPLEAMACGVPVVTSNISSLPEVVGEAGLKVNPYKEEEIALAIKKILVWEKLATSLRQKSLERAKVFSWEKTARETVKIYKEANKS